MRDYDEVSLHAASTRGLRKQDEDGRDAVLGRAAAEGRADAAGPHGVLRLQRQVGNAGTASMMEEERSPVHDVVSTGGEPLDRDVKADMESSLGHDFSDVRVHKDSAAHESAEAVQAKAYTVGSHMVFQRDAYDPSSDHGRQTLAHELTHVVQQRSGPVDGTEAPGGIKVSDPSDRFEREASTNAERVVSGGSVDVATAAGPSVQRQAEPEVEETTEEEDSVATQTYVQRQEELPQEEV